MTEETPSKPKEQEIETECVMLIHVLKTKNRPHKYLFVSQKNGEPTFQSKLYDKFSEVIKSLRNYLHWGR